MAKLRRAASRVGAAVSGAGETPAFQSVGAVDTAPFWAGGVLLLHHYLDLVEPWSDIIAG